MSLLQDSKPTHVGWSPLQVTVIFILLAPVLHFFYTAIKNRYFHPLRHFPGPFLASISPIYCVWSFLTEKEHLVIEKLHKKYGPIVRYQPDFLLFADPKVIPVIYNRYADKTEFNRIAYAAGEAPSVVAIIGHKEHAVARKRIAGAYSMSAARAVESIIDTRVIEWKEKLASDFAETGKELDFAKWSQYFAYDVISEIAFGKSFGFVQSASDVHTLIRTFQLGLKAVGILTHWVFFRHIVQHSAIAPLITPKADKTTGYTRLCLERDALVAERQRLGMKSGERSDLMQQFLESKNADGSPMPIPDVKAELLLVMFAGSDTTAATFRGVLLNVVQTPGCYEKLIAEIDDFVKLKGPELSVITFDDAQSLEYLTACIKESMRFSPATPILLPRQTMKGGMTLDDGRYIPETTLLSVNSHVTGRDKEVYGEDADVFNPNRWLENESKTAIMEKYDIHFGTGARVCLGKNIAILELWKGCFEFFRTFKPTLLSPEKIKFRNLGLLIHEDIWIKIEKRN